MLSSLLTAPGLGFVAFIRLCENSLDTPVSNTSTPGSILHGHDLIPCPSKLLVFLTMYFSQVTAKTGPVPSLS